MRLVFLIANLFRQRGLKVWPGLTFQVRTIQGKMPSSSQSIRLPNTRQKKKPRLQATEACRRQAKQDDASRMLREAKLDKLHEAHLKTNEPVMVQPRETEHATVDDSCVQVDFDQQNRNLCEPEDRQEIRQALNIGEFVAGHSYLTRRHREERAWGQNIRPMFITWMRCSSLTSNWGHRDLWCCNHFKEDSCNCPKSEKVSRKMDMVDLCSRTCLFDDGLFFLAEMNLYFFFYDSICSACNRSRTEKCSIL